MSSADGSAQKKYDTLSARHRAGRTRRVVVNITRATKVPSAWQAGWDRYGSVVLWLIGSMYLIAIVKAVVEPTHVRAWGIGAEDELAAPPSGEQGLSCSMFCSMFPHSRVTRPWRESATG